MIITENTILFKFHIVAIYWNFISQKAVNSRIITNALDFSLEKKSNQQDFPLPRHLLAIFRFINLSQAQINIE